MSGPTLLSLVRRWSVDWLNGQHPEVCEQILAPEYNLLIGGFVLGPREQYIPATLVQLGRYPGLVVTVHQLVCSEDRVALVFSEHGASARLEGRAAAWSGVAIFRWDGQALTGCMAEEDYYGRRRQLGDGQADPVERPMVAPWDQPAGGPDPDAEQVVRDWLAGSDLRGVPVVCDDEGTGQPATRLLAVESCRIDELFSSGDQVAFHAGQTGRYLGGLDGVDDLVGRSATIELAGLVTVRDGRVVAGRVVRDRLGTARTLREQAGVVPALGSTP